MQKLLTMCVFLVIVFSPLLNGQTVLYQEKFTGGTTQLKWSGGFNGDTMAVVSKTGNPSGDNWVGVVATKKSGGAVGLPYAGPKDLRSYSVEAQVWGQVDTTVATGPYAGIVINHDTSASKDNFYALVLDFDVSKQIRLRKQSAATPTIIKDFKVANGDVPGGLPTASGWFKLKLTVSNGKIWAYFNGNLLPGCPFTDSTYKAGNFGIYYWNMNDSNAVGWVDDIAITDYQTSPLLEEKFTGGNAQLTWSAGFNGDNMTVVSKTGNPSGDNWVGQIATKKSGGAVGLPYAGPFTMKNYSVEANVWGQVDTTVATGPYAGIVANHDTVGGKDTFYALVMDFDVSKQIRLRKQSSATPTIIKDFKVANGDVPGGLPTASGWFKLKLTVGNGKIWAYLNGTLLPGCPYSDATYKAGNVGVYYWNMNDSNAVGWVDDISVVDAPVSVKEEQFSTAPRDFALRQNYPNPFNPSTNIEFALPRGADIRLDVYNILGVKISTLVEGYRSAGVHHVTFNAVGLPSGIYFYQLRFGNSVQTQKMILMR
jgi:major membrane immunogen (membrane-anchored lipoprotein)